MSDHSDELELLRCALDQAQEGIIILDAEFRAQFMNRAVRQLWRVSDEQADAKPLYEVLVSDSRDTHTYGVPADQLEAFIARRVALVRRGDPTPPDIKTSDGRHIRSRCTVLPGGGRMLSYFDVTDLVNSAAELHKLATTDALTGLSNRWQCHTVADAEWDRSQRYRRPVSLLMIDIDQFKQVNDRFGHAAGDEAIRRIAAACRLDHRRTDVFGRLGGDEFGVLLPETAAAEACVLAERIREKAVAARIDAAGEPFTLTVSIGVAQASQSMSGAGALMHAADQALYRAKESGSPNTRRHAHLQRSPRSSASFHLTPSAMPRNE